MTPPTAGGTRFTEWLLLLLFFFFFFFFLLLFFFSFFFFLASVALPTIGLTGSASTRARVTGCDDCTFRHASHMNAQTQA